jgi:hypothetical protein
MTWMPRPLRSQVHWLDKITSHPQEKSSGQRVLGWLRATRDIAFLKSAGVLVPVGLDVPTSPMDVHFFRTPAVMAEPQNFDQVTVQLKGRLSCPPQWFCSLAWRRHGVPPVAAQTAHFAAILAASGEGVQVFDTVGKGRT